MLGQHVESVCAITFLSLHMHRDMYVIGDCIALYLGDHSLLTQGTSLYIRYAAM